MNLSSGLAIPGQRALPIEDTAVEIFNFGADPVRVVTVDGEPWFVASDVAKILGYRMASDMTRRLDPEDRGTHSARTPSGDQDMTIISEAGLYDAVLGSKVPGARAFKRWVTREVLPAIRRTGRYEVRPAQPQIPQTYSEALRLAADLSDRVDQQGRAIAALEPRAAVADALVDAAGDYSLREAAQVLCRDHGVQTGQNRLMASLRELEWVDAGGTPYQRVIDADWLRARILSYSHPRTGEPTLARPQIRVTPRGLARLHRLLTSPAESTVSLVEAA